MNRVPSPHPGRGPRRLGSKGVGAFRSVGDTAIQAGDSEQIVRRHYLDLKTEEEADSFWQIIPAGTKLPKKFEMRDGR